MLINALCRTRIQKPRASVCELRQEIGDVRATRQLRAVPEGDRQRLRPQPLHMPAGVRPLSERGGQCSSVEDERRRALIDLASSTGRIAAPFASESAFG